MKDEPSQVKMNEVVVRDGFAPSRSSAHLRIFDDVELSAVRELQDADSVETLPWQESRLRLDVAHPFRRRSFRGKEVLN